MFLWIQIEHQLSSNANSKVRDAGATFRKKIPNALGHCQTKRRMGAKDGHAPLGHDTKFVHFFLLKSRCHTKRRMDLAMRTHPSFGMTLTQDIRDLFVSQISNYYRVPGIVLY